MFVSGPIGSAACARVTATIRVAGERCTRGGPPLTKRVAEPIGFSMRGSLPRRECKMVTCDLDRSMRRLANYVECQISDVFQQLLAEKRSEDASSIAYHG